MPPFNIAGTSRTATLMRTTNYVETHHKTRANSAQRIMQKPEQPSERKQKTRAFTLKKFFCTQRTTRLPRKNT
jgi:hypothetical protein